MKNTKFELSLLKILSCALYFYWAMGDPNITVWHWLLPYLFDVVVRATIKVLEHYGE